MSSSLYDSLVRLADTASKRIAIIHGERQVSYGELLEITSGFANRLRLCGIGQGSRIAILCDNGVGFAVAFFAAAQTGSVVLLLNPVLGNPEIERAIRECDVSAAIAEQGRHQWFLDRRLAVFDPSEAATRRQRPVGRSDGDALFLIQYSSGSTALSKRVGRTQRNLVAEADNFSSAARLSQSDRFLCVVPFSHAHGLGNCLVNGVLAGGTLVIPGRPTWQSDDILELIRRERVTIFPGVPFMFDALAKAPSGRRSDLSSVRLCFSAGNFLAKNTFDLFLERYEVPVRQLYGCTEAGSVSLNLDPDASATWDSVGRPLGDTQLKLVDGEIAFKNAALTSGYLGNADSDRRYFRDGWFYTGDIGAFDGDGRLYLKGRRRLFIDIAGNKVDAQEVETLLLQLPAVEEAAVVEAELAPGCSALKAVIVPRHGFEPDDIVARCRERLTAFKCPSIFEFVAELPKSPLGKIRRGDLIRQRPLPGLEGSITAIEHVLRHEIAGLLGVPEIAIQSSIPLMEQGFTSSHSIELAACIRSRIGVPVSVTLVWNYPTISSIAKHVMEGMSDAARQGANISAADGHNRVAIRNDR
jgi:long-chain acyl-CoA synthetase